MSDSTFIIILVVILVVIILICGSSQEKYHESGNRIEFSLDNDLCQTACREYTRRHGMPSKWCTADFAECQGFIRPPGIHRK